MSNRAANPWVLKYIVSGLIWGGSFLFIELALGFLEPIGVAFWRGAFGTLAMLVVIAINRSKLPKDFEIWKRLTIAGLFMSAIPFALFAFAQQYVSSALAGIINAMTPIATVLMLLVAFRTEKPKPHVVFGLFVGLIGVLVVLGVWQGFGTNEPLAIIALLAAILCYGIGTPYVRNYVTPLKLATEISVLGQIGTATVMLLPFYIFTGKLFVAVPSLIELGAIIAVGALGSGVAYLLYYQYLEVVGSAIASAVTYITPIIAVILGFVLLGETLHWYEPVGGLIVILGAAISQGSILNLFKGSRVAKSN